MAIVFDEHIKTVNGVLHLEDVFDCARILTKQVPLSSLAQEFGTPLYAVSELKLRTTFRSFRNAFASRHASTTTHS